MEPFPLPPELVAQNRAFAEGDATPAEPRNAATVLLVRPAPDGVTGQGPEVYLMRRQQSMAFAGGMWVFPGGGVDPTDADPAVAWAGPSPAEWAKRLGTDEALARSLVCAAVRETFEESGVLLAGPDERSVVADTTGEDWEADRVALESRALSFHDLLLRRGLVLRSDLLGAFSAWLTPLFEPRRYRTWFFVASLPQGQVTRDISSESSAVEWCTARSAVEMATAGEVVMLPPTFQNLLDVARFATPDDVLADAADRTVEMFMPEVAETADGEFALTQHPDWAALVAQAGL